MLDLADTPTFILYVFFFLFFGGFFFCKLYQTRAFFWALFCCNRFYDFRCRYIYDMFGVMTSP